MSLPKILFLADEIPQSKNAGSILFFRLLNDYPADKLLIIGKKPTAGATTLSCRYVELNFPFADRIRQTRFNQYFADLESVGILKYRLPENVRKEIADFKPELVITLMQLYMYYQPACSFAIDNKIPLIIFCHDDVEEFSRVHSIFKKLLIARNTFFYQKAMRRICISDQMESAWKEKYKASGDVLYPLPSSSLIPRNFDDNLRLKVNAKLTLGYAGTPAYGYSYQMEEMIPMLEKLGGTLRFYGSKLPDNLKNYSCVEFGGFDTPENTWVKVKAECDAVLLPYSWKDGSYKSLYMTHFPSKLPEYLSLGMPVVVAGPSYATGVAWALENKDAVVVLDQPEKETWFEKLNQLKHDDKLRKQLAMIAVGRKNEYFSPEVIKRKFIQLITQQHVL